MCMFGDKPRYISNSCVRANSTGRNVALLCVDGTINGLVTVNMPLFKRWSALEEINSVSLALVWWPHLLFLFGFEIKDSTEES